MKKGLEVLLCTTMLSITLSLTSLAGEWKQENAGRWKYQDNDGNYITSSTVDWFIDPETGWSYHFDSQGYMQTGLIDINGVNYFCDTNGAKVFNSITTEGYIIDADGVVTNNLPGVTMLYGWNPSKYTINLAIMNKSNESFIVDNYCTLITNNMSRTLYMVDIETLSFVDNGIIYGGIQEEPSNATVFTFLPNDYGQISVDDSSTVEFYFIYNGNSYYYYNEQSNPLIINIQ